MKGLIGSFASGAMLVCMAGGFLGSSAWPQSDLIGKVAIDVIATAWMLRFAGRIRRRAVPRASRRLARFAQAIKKTKQTVPSSNRIAGRRTQARTWRARFRGQTVLRDGGSGGAG